MLTKRFSFLSLIVIISSICFAEDKIEIEPTRISVFNLPVGQKIDIEKYSKTPFIIYNRTNDIQSFLVEVKKPSIANKRLLQGYNDIPNTSWIKFRESEIVVYPKMSRKITIYAEIPNDEKYCNQHWEAVIEVKTKSKEEKLFNIILCGQLLIETNSKRFRYDKIFNNLWGLFPTIIRFENIEIGEKYVDTVKLYNNEKISHTYRIVIVNPPDTAIEQFIPRTNGYDRIIDEKWVTISIPDAQEIKRERNGKNITPIKEIEIKSESNVPITLEVNIPGREEFKNKKWEALLFVYDREKNKTEFGRIQIQTRK